MSEKFESALMLSTGIHVAKAAMAMMTSPGSTADEASDRAVELIKLWKAARAAVQFKLDVK